MGIRGVNLGGWLVFEKWMKSPYLSMVKSEDDHDMLFEFPPDQLDEILKNHRDNYITESDFDFMKEQGVDTVRLPIPYYVFGTAHHSKCIEYVDDAMDWAADRGIGVLLDLHTVPMSQNGYDNGGYIGMCSWHHSKARVDWTIGLLVEIAERYRDCKSLWGIEPLNEPASEYAMKQTARKYGSIHPYRLAKSSGISHKFLKEFYYRLYDDLSMILPEEVKFVVSDRYQPKAWNYFMSGMLYQNVVIDTHKYCVFKEWAVNGRELEDYKKVAVMLGDEVAEASRFHDVVIGEWCLANHADNPDSDWYKEYSSEQIKQWDRGHGGFFWSYRNDAPGFENWSFRHSVENGWIDFVGGESNAGE